MTQQLVDYPPRSTWQRLFGPPVDPGHQALEIRLDKLQRKVLRAQVDHARAKHALQTEERKFQTDQGRHHSALAARKVQAESRIETARAARTLLQKNPRAAFWGAPHLMRVAADIQKARSQWRSAPDSDLPSDWDLIPVFDLWGKPFLPPSPKA